MSSTDSQFEPKIVGFLCNWCSYRAADLAGSARITHAPNVRIIRVMCSGRMDPAFVTKALALGADGVMLAATSFSLIIPAIEIGEARGRILEDVGRVKGDQLGAAAMGCRIGVDRESAAFDCIAKNGVGMTISGQIAGRKILKSVTPQYTARARQKGWEGVVAVHFTVLADGRVKDNTYFQQSSVHRDLNQMALEAIKQFRFAPLPAEQSAVEQWGVITIVFRLN